MNWLTTVIFAGDANAASKASDEADRQLNLQQAIHSYGDVILTAGGAVREVGTADPDVDVIADSLTIASGTGVSGIETSLNAISSIINTSGDVRLGDVDSVGETSLGLSVVFVQNSQGSVFINVPGDLDVQRINAPGTAADIALHSGGVFNLLPVSGITNTVVAGRDLFLTSDGKLFLGSGFTAPDKVDFSSLIDVKLNGVTLNLSTAEPIVIESDSSLSMSGLLESAKSVTLISNHGDVQMKGTIRGRNGQPLDSLTVIARGNLVKSGEFEGQFRFRSLDDDATYYSDTPELSGTSHVVDEAGQPIANFALLDLVPYTTTNAPVVKDQVTGLDFFRDPTNEQLYLRYISPDGEEYYRRTDPTTGYFPFTALRIDDATHNIEFVQLLYSTKEDPTDPTAVLYAADKTTVLDRSVLRNFDVQLLHVTDNAITSRLVPLTIKDLSGGRATGTSVSLLEANIGAVTNSVTMIAQGQVNASPFSVTGANSTITVLTSEDVTTGAWKAANISIQSTGLFDSQGTFIGGSIVVPVGFTTRRMAIRRPCL